MNRRVNENCLPSVHRIWQAWMLLVLGLIVTAVAAFYARTNAEANAKHEFDFACNEIRLKIERRLNAHAQILRSGAAFFNASDSVTREKWHVFTMHQKIAQQLPGIQGIGFSLLIPREQLAQHIQEIRAQGFPEYTVKPEGQRDIYSSIIYLEPFSGRNLRAFAYDMLTEPVRRAAMERTRDTDSPTLSGKVILVQETDQDIQAGTLMFVPVYRKGMPTDTVESRRSALYGWVYSPYRMNDLMEGILGGWDLKNDKRIRLQIFDEQFSPENLLYDSQPNIDQKSDFSSMFIMDTAITSAGRGWILRFARTGIQISGYIQVWLVIFSGTIITLLLFALALTLFNTRVEARKIAEQLTADLKESEENFRAFFDTIEHLLFVLDNTGNMIRINRAVIARLGFEESELLGKNVLTVHPEEHREEAGRIISEMLEGKRDHCPVPLLCKDGNYIPVETRIVKGRWSGQDVLFGVSKDISDIRASEEKFSKIFYSNPSAMAISDLESGRFTDVNNVLLKTLGYERDELIGKSSAELGLFVDSRQRASLVKLLSEQGDLKNYEVKVRRKSGEVRYGLFSAEILSLQSRKLLLTMMDDISERKQAEHELLRAKQLAESANRAKSQFLASMSHELRTPLTGVISLSEALSEEAYGDLNEKQRRAIRTIESSGKHLLDLITDILDLSKIEAGQMELQIETSSVSDICQSALQLSKGVANKKQHQISFCMNPVSASIEADPRRLKQMLVNLLSNAVKFTPHGGQIGLDVKGDQAGQFIYFSVTDTGIGIAPEMFHKLFKPFVQLDSRLSRQYSGTGLGLSLVRCMAELHGGSVGVESELGKGSRFTIGLPWKTSEQHLSESSDDKDCDLILSEQAVSKERLSEALILLVEDNEVNTDLYSDYLQSRGCRVILAKNGRECIEKTTALHPDLILMDIQMPEMDGLEATRILRADANAKIASTPIIALTSLAMLGDKEKCLASGVDDYLSKPVPLNDLLKTIEKYLNSRKDKL